MKRVLVTGPDGFVGSALCATLLQQGFAVRGAQWQTAPLPHGCESVVVGRATEATGSRLHISQYSSIGQAAPIDRSFPARKV